MLENVTNTAEPDPLRLGMNWLSFIDFVDEARIRAARDLLPGDLSALSGPTFLDIGCGRQPPRRSERAEPGVGRARSGGWARRV
jgi:hypothetical protein